MSIIDSLNNLQNNLNTAKQVLVDNISAKGVSVTTADTLTDIANSVLDIPQEGGGGTVVGDAITDWSSIGYNTVPQKINDGWTYAKQIYDTWDSSITNMTFAFKGNTQLVFMPQVDTSNVRSMRQAFESCTNLLVVPSVLNTSNVTEMQYVFAGCDKLESLDLRGWDVSNVTTISHIFSGCKQLTSLDVSGWDTSKVGDMDGLVNNCENLISLDLSSWDTSSVTSIANIFQNCNNVEVLKLPNNPFIKVNNVVYIMYDGSPYNNSKLRVLEANNLGCGINNSGYDVSNTDVLGVNNDTYPNARQILTSTFVTNSFDRAAAGYNTCTLRFSSTVKSLFTEEEIAQITSKGYTIA